MKPYDTLQKMQYPRNLNDYGGFALVGPVGIEPTTHGLKVRCSNLLS
jgi:hypothetical protein